MNYSSLEDAFGTPFGQRLPLTVAKEQVEPPKKKEENKNKELIEYVIKQFPKDCHKIYDIMTSDKAKKECPLWI